MQLPIGDKVPLQLNVFDAQGDPIPSVTPAPVWSSSDPTVATVEPAADGFSATCTSVKAGSVVITCQVNANVSASLAVDVVPGIPASATITAGEPAPISGS